MNVITIVINTIAFSVGCTLMVVGMVENDDNKEIKGLLIMILSTLILTNR